MYKCLVGKGVEKTNEKICAFVSKNCTCFLSDPEGYFIGSFPFVTTKRWGNTSKVEGDSETRKACWCCELPLRTSSIPLLAHEMLIEIHWTTFNIVQSQVVAKEEGSRGALQDAGQPWCRARLPGKPLEISTEVFTEVSAYKILKCCFLFHVFSMFCICLLQRISRRCYLISSMFSSVLQLCRLLYGRTDGCDALLAGWINGWMFAWGTDTMAGLQTLKK